MKRKLFSISVVVLICAGVVLAQASSRPTATDPTTPHLDAIFLGRCFEIAPKCDCAKLWRTFYNITAYKDPNTITRDSYQPLFNEARHCLTTGTNKTLLSSGRADAELTEQLSNRCERLCTSADVLPGYALNREQFCGSTEGPDFNYTSCPKGVFSELENKWYNARHAFWEASHVEFAQRATGVVTILVHAHDGTAYKEHSTLARLQIPSLSPAAISAVHVLVVRNTTSKPPEVCGSGSLVDLMADLEKKFQGTQVKLACEDSPLKVRLILCEREPDSPECTLSSQTRDAFDDSEFTLFEIVSAGVSSFIFGVLMSVVIVVAIARRSQERRARYEQQHRQAQQHDDTIHHSHSGEHVGPQTYLDRTGLKSSGGHGLASSRHVTMHDHSADPLLSAGSRNNSDVEYFDSDSDDSM